MDQLSFCTDKKLQICSWGKRIAKFTGKSSSVVIGKKYYEVLPRICVDDKDALSISLKKNEKIHLNEYSFNCIYSSIKTDIKISPLYSNNGKVNKVRVSLTLLPPFLNLTPGQNPNYSQRLIDIGKIASTLAHGVRNPLNAIKGAVVYLREKYKNEVILIEFTKIMEEEISRLDSFISRFLSSSISDADESPTDLNELLKRIETFTSLQAHIGEIETIYEFGKVPPILMNSFQIEQALLNVINNAIEAMENGGKLTITTQTENRTGILYAVIEISDTGHGMVDRRLGDPSFSVNDGGKGFGLFITHEILRNNNGYMEIMSKKNSGTTVKLFIPYS